MRLRLCAGTLLSYKIRDFTEIVFEERYVVLCLITQ